MIVIVWVVGGWLIITMYVWWEARTHAKRWKQIAARWEAQSKKWEHTANRHKYTAEMWEDMYQGERDHV